MNPRELELAKAAAKQFLPPVTIDRKKSRKEQNIPTGVYPKDGSYHVRFTRLKKTYRVGTFKTLEEATKAAEAYLKKNPGRSMPRDNTSLPPVSLKSRKR